MTKPDWCLGWWPVARTPRDQRDVFSEEAENLDESDGLLCTVR